MKPNGITGLSFIGLVQIGCLLVLVFSLAPFLSRLFWYLDLLSHFRFQYLVLSIFLTIGFLFFKNKVYLAMSVVGVLINSVFVIPVLTQTNNTSGELHQNSLKLFHANVLTSNNEYKKLIAQITEESPDIILLQEVDQQWVASLAAIKSKYKFSIEVPRNDNFGMALFSKIPIQEYQIHDWTDLEIPAIEAAFNLADQTLRIITTHPPPPVNKYYYDAGTAEFEAIASTMKGKEYASIVIGDLNTTIWSEQYKTLESSTGLVNVSNGFGLIPTWPTNLIPLMIPIDHCLVSNHFNVINVKTGNDFGSDHLPLIVELGF